MPRPLYAVAAIVGTLVPYLFFLNFFASSGLNVSAFIQNAFSTPVGAGFTSDLLISSAVFWAWSYFDARALRLKGWWAVVPATVLVGLSLAMPLYFLLRSAKSE
ncbi:MAG: DUF2834 domain-containing protein [Devosia sp.]